MPANLVLVPPLLLLVLCTTLETGAPTTPITTSAVRPKSHVKDGTAAYANLPLEILKHPGLAISVYVESAIMYNLNSSSAAFGAVDLITLAWIISNKTLKNTAYTYIVNSPRCLVFSFPCSDLQYSWAAQKVHLSLISISRSCT